MSRYFNHKKIELLAPAGNMATFKRMVKANCDAIYLGGKSLNMRMIRKDYNFSNEEIQQAAAMAHHEDKLVYVTVNNMLNNDEINEAVEYLYFLQDAHVDGIIVQDPGILQICREENLNKLDIHASVMMNVHNSDTVKELKKFGVSRVVVSREMDLKTAKLLQSETGVETEYFMHGDMCTVNGANCYYSSIVLGNSSNRGRCFKPCRWDYRVKKDGLMYPTEYPLAAKDMCMYEHIPELIEANVTSFKIEGRMREADFIVELVNTYGEAIDRYIDDPLSFDRQRKTDQLFENRKRDFSTAYAFSNPGLDFVNRRYEGTGKFYSTGKVFSTPTEEPAVTEKALQNVRLNLPNRPDRQIEPSLSVKVNNYEQAKLCTELGVQRIYLPCEVLLPDSFITLEQLTDLINIKGDTDIFLDLPQMMNELQCDMIDHYLSRHGHFFDGLLVSSLGAIEKYAQKYHIVTDYNVNIYNRKAVDFYHSIGVDATTVSIEMTGSELSAFMGSENGQMEVIVHGPLRVMYLDLNLYENTKAFEAAGESSNKYTDDSVLVLKSDKGENPVYIDQNGKNHLYTSKEICLLPVLNDLQQVEGLSFRIEGQTYKCDELKNIIEIYQTVLEDRSSCEDLSERLESCRAGFTLGALSF